MVYSTDSPLQGRGTASASVVQAWMTSHAQEGANYVKLPVVQLSADLGQAIADECAAAGINSDLVAAQIAHESSYAQSDFARNRNNFSGMGAVNDNPGLAITFPTPRSGIHAQVSHLRSYVEGAANPWRADDPRYAAAQAAGYLASCRVLADLSGRWAWPGTGYAEAIAAHANDLLAYAAAHPDNQGSTPTVVGNPTQADIGYPVTIAWADAIGPARPLSSVYWLIVHYTGGGSWPADATYLQHHPQGASAHAVIGANGELWYEVPIDRTAWTAGNDDVSKASIEVELSSNGSSFTDAQYRSLAAFFNWCRKQPGINIPAEYVGKDDRPGICGHQDVADPNNPGQWGGVSHHTDPGPNFNWSKLVGYMTAGTVKPQVVTPPAPVQPAPQPAAPEPDVVQWGLAHIGHGFKVLRDKLNGFEPDLALRVMGLTITEEFDMQVSGQPQAFTYQVCERAVLKYEAGNAPPWDCHVATLAESAEVLVRLYQAGKLPKDRLTPFIAGLLDLAAQLGTQPPAAGS